MDRRDTLTSALIETVRINYPLPVSGLVMNTLCKVKAAEMIVFLRHIREQIESFDEIDIFAAKDLLTGLINELEKLTND